MKYIKEEFRKNAKINKRNFDKVIFILKVD